jgi:hypothetical protein
MKMHYLVTIEADERTIFQRQHHDSLKMGIEIGAVLESHFEENTSGPIPRVTAQAAPPADAKESEALQLLREIMTCDANTVEGDRIMFRSIQRAKELFK